MGWGSQPEGQGGQYILEVLRILLKDIQGDSELVSVFPDKEPSFAHFGCPWFKQFCSPRGTRVPLKGDQLWEPTR